MPDPFTRRATAAIGRLIEHAPATGGLALRIAQADLPPGRVEASGGRSAAPVSTDGDTLYYTAAFDALPVDRQAGWVAHVVLHAALRHPQRLQSLRERLGDVDAELFEVCADAIVDGSLADLGWLAPREAAVPIEQLMATVLGRHVTRQEALQDWDVERLYREIDDRRTAGLRQAGRQPGDGSGSDRRTKQADRGGVAAAQCAGAPGTGTPGDGAPGDGTPGDGAPGDGAPGDGAPGGGTPGADPPGADPPGADPPGADPPGADPPGGGAPGTRASTRLDGPRAARARAFADAGRRDLLTPAAPRSPEDEAAHAQGWAARLARAHADDGAFSLLRDLSADLPRTRTPWEQVLRFRLARALSRRLEVCWSRPSRSWLATARRRPGRPWEPAVLPGRATPKLAVIVDVSGSVDAALLERFGAEIEAIVRRLEAGTVLVLGDDRVRRVETFEPGRTCLRDLCVAGGGGTDFTPLLEEAARRSPDAIVVLTDLDGPARHRPRCPVVWAVPAAARRATPPFGAMIVLD